MLMMIRCVYQAEEDVLRMYEDIELEIEKLKFEIKEIEIQGGARGLVTKALFKIERKLGEIDAYEKILRYIRCTEKDGK